MTSNNEIPLPIMRAALDEVYRIAEGFTSCQAAPFLKAAAFPARWESWPNTAIHVPQFSISTY